MNLELQGKSVLVTGGSRGIGYACCEMFAAEGCNVTILGSQKESVEGASARLEAQVGRKVEAICLDLGQPDAVSDIRDRLRLADIIVNNAGAIPGGGLEDVSDSAWRQAWDLKVHGYINTTREALPAMIERGTGVIVNVIGIAGAAPRYDYICGSSANSALMTFTKAAGAHAARHGVRIVGVNPGPTETDRLVKLYQSRAAERLGDASRWQEMLADMPFGRVAKPEEIASLVVFLASARASYISGAIVDVDGGAMYG
ncbi:MULTISPECIES: short-chain dehydrogenase/reductase [unclassified Burkholderia]|uniref:short-chain dehydrogenase/reductase n=1 Tax=unclassified Burkholderia TaxID=2613784 RepID=UPI000F56E0C1|nr:MULTISPECIES: short-chain dehydrogenase/reductase [unclassified Burkholderia]RQS26833.1 SDR family NAD(P)-dependent oxidoreductase [Burkholderia sp. Bp8995]RQS51719.1 SDR family NAD(P)-dependent oxidoreductase [Burkholderia sp. Bp8989]